MDFSVSYLNFGCIVFNILMGALIPVVMLVYLWKKYNCETKLSWIGCAAFIVFALILENIVNSILLGSIGGVIQRSLLIYGLYSGFMAALFEDVGRFLVFKTVLRKYNGNDYHALMYTVGHGGFELFMLLILPMLSYAAYAVSINTGNVQALFDGITEQQASALTETLSQLSSAAPLTFLLSLLNRAAALAVQSSMSVIVWFAAKRSARAVLLPAALLMHTFINAVSLILTGYSVPALLATFIVCCISALYILITLRIWKASHPALTPPSG